MKEKEKLAIIKSEIQMKEQVRIKSEIALSSEEHMNLVIYEKMIKDELAKKLMDELIKSNIIVFKVHNNYFLSLCSAELTVILPEQVTNLYKNELLIEKIIKKMIDRIIPGQTLQPNKVKRPKKILQIPYGGLGDSLQYSTLPREFNKLGFDFYLR
jgi:hypothetical protein